MNCVLCLYGRDLRVAATGVVDGCSLCDDCQLDVLHWAPYIWRDANNRVALEATVKQLNPEWVGKR